MNILHLEDNPDDAELIGEILRAELPACTVNLVESRAQFLAALADRALPDLVISDFSLPAFDGLDALTLVRQHSPGIPFVFVSGSIGEERAIAAARAGAYDYVLKDNMARLPVVIRRALEESQERRRHDTSERRLRELAGIIERAGEAIVVTDLEDRITLWNDGAVRLYGLSAAEAVGRLAKEVFPAAISQLLPEAHRATRESGAWRRDLSITTHDGRDIVIDFSLTLVRDRAGGPGARLCLATDVTEKKRLEEQSLRSQRLESLGLLAAGIAHDLNNVLAPVLMAGPLLRQQLTAPADIHIVDILERSAERGSALVRQILGFAHGAGGGARLTQVKHLFRDVGDVIRASFPKSIVLDESIAHDLWPIQANPTQVHQILLNLAVNARDAMLPRGGKLGLRAENCVLDESIASAMPDGRPGAFVLLEVSDAGTGMTPDVLARIWEPFFTTKGEGKGTGLGLSTVRGIAAAHGGFVAVDTRIGRGTTFRVFLPAAERPAEPSGGNAALPAFRGQGELVLIVDDEAHVRDVAATILGRFGYRVMKCGDGIEAISLFTKHSAEVRLVISDMNMPNLDGPALAQVLRRLRADVRILAITGVETNDAAAAGEKVFVAQLAKPFTVPALLEAVHQALNAAPGASAGGLSPA